MDPPRLDRPLGVTLLGAVLGIDAFSLRLASAIFGILAIPVALFTSLTLAVTLWPIHFSRFGIRVIMMPVIFSAAFGLFWLGGHASTRRRRLWAYAGSGLFLGLGPWTHPTGRLAPLALIVYVVWLPSDGYVRSEYASAKLSSPSLNLGPANSCGV